MTAAGHRLEWRGSFEHREVNRLHAEAFEHGVYEDDWLAQVSAHSLGWVCARDADEDLVGFANVPWDGALHAFVLDVMVSTRVRRRGLGKAMVALVADEARAAGCEWLPVAFDDQLKSFYFDACGFRAIQAGLLHLYTLD